MFTKLNYIFSGKDKLRLFILLVMVIVATALELAAVAVFQPFTEALTAPDAVMDGNFMGFIYSWLALSSIEEFLAAMCVVIAVIYVAKNIFVWCTNKYILDFSYGLQRRIALRLMNSYVREPYASHVQKNIAVLQRSLQDDTALFAQLLVHSVQLICEFLVCIVLGIMLFRVSNSMAVIIGVMLLVCVGLFIKVTGKYTKNLGKESQLYKAKAIQWVNQSMSGIKEIKILGREDFFIDKYRRALDKYIFAFRTSRLIMATPKNLIELVCMVGLMIAIVVKIFFGQGGLDGFLPQLAVFAVAAFRLLPSASRINDHSSNVLYAMPSLNLIYEDLKSIEETRLEEEHASEKSQDAKGFSFERGIRIRHLTYAYPGTEQNIFTDACCEIPKGKTVAFIGATGSGKTTMADIVLGLLSPQLGKVLADDLNVHKNLDTWHSHVSYIPQNIYLSDDTIRNNVAFGLNEEEIDDEKVNAALEKASLAEFVEALPDGLQTYVGDRGIRLSGGQRQRIGIARALYNDAEILVLDEATSALDNETEAAVMEAIEHLQGEKTMLIIAHRLTTIKNADIIYEVGDGKISRCQKNA